MKNILCPIDGSDPSFRALELATAFGADLTVLVVLEYVVGRYGVADIWSEAEAKEIFDQAKEIVLKASFQRATFVEKRSRDAAFTIVDFSEDKQIDLLVIGASGKGALKRFVLGSVSSDVARKSHCPVTIVH